jgi:hypothetical protein
LADGLERRQGLLHLAVTGINPGHVPAASVPADENHAAAQGGFDGHQYVETIEPKFLPAQLGRPDAVGVTPLASGLGTGASGDGDALSAGQVMTVAHQFRSAADAIPMVQQPAQITGCLAQDGQAGGPEQALVFRVRAPVPVEFSHGIMGDRS